MLKIIYLSAGHDYKTDPGVITSFGKERDFNKKIKDALIPELERQGFEVQGVPDDLSLRESIDWVNKRVKGLEGGLALEIHCNCCKQEGTEAYYFTGSLASKQLAARIVDKYSQEMGMINRGARADNTSRVGKLGWIRLTNCWAILIEVGYLDNKDDVKKIKDFSKTARSITKGVCEIFDIKYIDTYIEKPEPTSPALVEIIEVLRKYKLI